MLPAHDVHAIFLLIPICTYIQFKLNVEVQYVHIYKLFMTVHEKRNKQGLSRIIAINYCS